ncbi:MAG: zinc metallopeptidase [Ruminococcaceae bacterium]|nr:zinc metallopeptidase [Oscillospiraceae bacterium]
MLLYGIDATYIIIVLPAILFSVFMQFLVNSTYKKYATKLNSRNLTGAQVAQRVLSAFGISNVRIEHVSGDLTDHFDPRTNVIRLSDSVYNSTSVAAAGVAAHECGHAMQYASAYAPIKIRNTILPVCNIGSTLSMPLILIGFFVSSQPLVNFGIILFALVALFQLITLPVEFNASRRALAVLEDSGILDGEEKSGAKKVLSAAAMTYVAALAVSLAQLLRLLILFGGRRDD